MGQVSVIINGRNYRLACSDGEEGRLLELATHVKARVDQLTREFGQVGDDRLLLMTALLVADELWDTRLALEVQIEEAADMLRRLGELQDGDGQGAQSSASRGKRSA
ncbi:MAG: cell division protein ZapA [Hyphomicrobiaceae bacterium]|nr:cell division protein ZapA [Hyphomicrobiaceae bacterium]